MMAVTGIKAPYWDTGGASIHPKAHGALADGSDDAVAIQAAIDAAVLTGVPVDGGRLTYTVASAINGKDAKIRNLRLKAHASFVGDRLYYSDEAQEIEYLHLDGSGLALRAADLGVTAGGAINDLRITELVAENFIETVAEPAANTRCINIQNQVGGSIDTLTTRNCRHRNLVRISTGCIGMTVRNRRSFGDTGRVAVFGGDGTTPQGCLYDGIFIYDVREGDRSGGIAIFASNAQDCHFRNVEFAGCDTVSFGMQAVKLAEGTVRCTVRGIRGRIYAPGTFNGVLSIQGGTNDEITDFDIEDIGPTAGTASLLFARQHPTTEDPASGAVFSRGRISGAKPCQFGSQSGSTPAIMEDAVLEDVEIVSTGSGLTLLGKFDNLRIRNTRIHASAARALNVDVADTAPGDITNLSVTHCTFRTDAATEAVRLTAGGAAGLEFSHNRARANNGSGNAVHIDGYTGVAHNNSISGGAKVLSVNVDDQGNVVEP